MRGIQGSDDIWGAAAAMSAVLLPMMEMLPI